MTGVGPEVLIKGFKGVAQIIFMQTQRIPFLFLSAESQNSNLG